MPRPLKDLATYLRSGYFVDGLLDETGLSSTVIGERVGLRYQKLGLQAPSSETVRDYFRLRGSPGVDPLPGGGPSWLLACEFEFPGTSYRFFHPVFELLFDSVESSAKWRARLERIPEAWIQEEEDHGYKDVAASWRAHNESVRAKRGRPPTRSQVNELSYIHESLMRLPDPTFSILFGRKGLHSSYYRNWGAIEFEISRLASDRTMEGITASVGLVLESAAIGDSGRLDKSRRALEERLAAISNLPGCSRIRDDLVNVIKSDACLRRSAKCYERMLTSERGLPATWRMLLKNPFVAKTEAELERQQT